MRYTVFETQNKAIKVWVENNKVCILLSDESEIRFPIDSNKRLKNATPLQVNNIEIIANGTGLHWPELDEDLSISE